MFRLRALFRLRTFLTMEDAMPGDILAQRVRRTFGQNFGHITWAERHERKRQQSGPPNARRRTQIGGEKHFLPVLLMKSPDWLKLKGKFVIILILTLRPPGMLLTSVSKIVLAALRRGNTVACINISQR